MKVLLIPPKNNYPDPVPHVDLFGQGLPYIAGSLKSAGHTVFGININHLWCEESAKRTLEIAINNEIWDHRPDLICVGGLSGDYVFIRDSIELIRKIEPGIPIVCGGGIVTYDREYIFSALRPDIGVVGEAEKTILEIIDFYEGRKDISTIDNIAYWSGGTAVFNRINHPNTRIEDLPYPDYEPFDFERFMGSFNQIDTFYSHTRARPRIMPITLGRSCPFKCTFCCHTSGPVYRERTIDSTIEEIVHFYRKYAFNILFIYDELFSVNKKRIQEFCDKIQKIKSDYNMDFDWTCDLRVNNVDLALLKEMKNAGCIFVGYGLESASPTILKSMKKGTTPENIRQALSLSDEAGLGVQGNFILGDIAETHETIEETVAFLKTYCRDYMVFPSHVMPYPGSEIFKYAVDNGIIIDKKYYYEHICLFGTYKINITKMADADYFKNIEDIEKLLDISKNPLNIKEARIISCIKTSELADPEMPRSRRRRFYTVLVVCPHCGKTIQYLCPLVSPYFNQPARIRSFCTECHKRLFFSPFHGNIVSNHIRKSVRYFSRHIPEKLR